MIDFNIKEVPEVFGAKLISYRAFQDERGVIYSTFQTQLETKLQLNFTHDKFVSNEPNALRGLHGDYRTAKLVTCVSGKITQVILDVRPTSPTYGNGFHIEIDQNALVSLFVPIGVANAFYSSASAVYHYKLAYPGEYADHDEQFTFHWQSPAVKTYWGPINPILSQRDQNAGVFQK